MKLPNEILNQKDKIIAICLKYKVSKLYVFGSVSKGTFNPNKSDVDLIVELEPMDPVAKGEALLNLWNEMENLFARKVDLITMQKIKNPFLKEDIDISKKLIYDKAS